MAPSRRLLCSLLCFDVVSSFCDAFQFPFSSHSFISDLEAWDLESGPDVNNTGHLVFETVSSLLQEWPNTRYRHGHNLIPASVPTGTLLYHGRSDNKIPTVPEWLATDPEHSYMFCRTMQEDSGCWHLTLVTIRPLKVLYFDGSSAAKMQDGSMDTQDVVAWKKVMPEKYFRERERATALCDWAKKFGIDGFVRMEMDFEIILCDFTVGVEVESFLELRSIMRRGPGGPGGPRHPPGDPPPGPPPSSNGLPFSLHGSSYMDPDYPLLPPPPPHMDFGSPFGPPPPGSPRVDKSFNEVLASGSWHNRFPGETRIKLDLTKLISFYDTSLVPSLVEARFGKTRLEHRVLGISELDLTGVMKRLESIYSGSAEVEASGIDWSTLFHVIVDRYANRLEMVRYLLNTTGIDVVNTDDDEAYWHLARARTIQEQLNVMLRPYTIHSAVPQNTLSSAWASPIYKLCATSHTRYISSSTTLTSSEALFLNAIQETNREICRVVTKMWVQGIIEGGLDEDLSPHPRTKPSGDVEPGKARTTKDDQDDESPNIPLKSLLTTWKAEITTLMSWLDWSVWIKCNPTCSFEEMCYLPTWPFGLVDGRDDWKDPQPRCIRRITLFS